MGSDVKNISRRKFLQMQASLAVSLAALPVLAEEAPKPSGRKLVIKKGDEIIGTFLAPPQHWNCRCTVAVANYQPLI